MIEILSPGLLSTVQDLGRTGLHERHRGLRTVVAADLQDAQRPTATAGLVGHDGEHDLGHEAVEDLGGGLKPAGLHKS